MKRITVAVSAAFALSAALWAASAIGDQVTKPSSAPSPQRQVAQAWVTDMDHQDLRAACEMQTEGQAKGLSAVGEPCGSLPTSGKPPACPAYHAGSKPRYRKSEIRTAAEQVGEFTEEIPTRGFVRINAQVKARKAWGTLGLEQVAGVWRITYLRYGEQVVFPAGNVFQTWPSYDKLWITNWCPTDHPKWEKNE